ncbi:NTPase KAP [candidate division TA06 bacterium]|uniref:NTPase KAP n=1 Tax=candidate division TA06 bacterium TaxID=2250710 RepID=A0A523USZ8_UNCT6|nr:MAG: NTPase KAP [candidate division TA06 bacterium]
MTEVSQGTLSADRPKEHPDDDNLGYAPFAKHLAESICRMAPTEGLVMAVYGPWGSGKSTLLNFVVHYLQQMSESEQPVVVRFNPWWFSGHEDLTRRFFVQLQAVLRSRGDIWDGIRVGIADFAELVSVIPTPYTAGAKLFARRVRPKERDVPEVKSRISGLLRNQKNRILVVMDDIDRLAAEEIRSLFRVIKSVADFPNVIYLLVFDRKVVVEALQPIQGMSGEAYLEKIVQVPFELPLPEKFSLVELLFERLDAVSAGTDEELFDRTRFANVYKKGIDHFINTPRDVVRLSNALTVSYAPVRGEVNPVDFVAVEALRVFCPFVYDIIRRNPEAFVGPSSDGISGGSLDDELKPFHESWLKKIAETDQESIKQLIMEVFPKLEAVWSNMHYGSDWESTWRKELRVCSADVFSVYFRLSVPETGISNLEMEILLAHTGDAEALGNTLVDLAGHKYPGGRTKARAFLNRLEDYTAEAIPPDHIPEIAKALFEVGDNLVAAEGERSSMFDLGVGINIGRVLRQLLRRLDEPARFKILREGMSNGGAISTIVDEVATLGQEHGKYGVKEPYQEEKRFVTEAHLKELENVAVEKIRQAASGETLLQAPALPRVLSMWKNWDAIDEVKSWVNGVIKDDSGLVILLERFLQKSFRQSVSDVAGTEHYRLDPKWFEHLFDPDEIIDRVRRLRDSAKLTERQRSAAAQFVEEYKMRQRGEDPDSPMAWRK